MRGSECVACSRAAAEVLCGTQDISAVQEQQSEVVGTVGVAGVDAGSVGVLRCRPITESRVQVAKWKKAVDLAELGKEF